MKNLIKSIIFLTIFIILLHVCSNIFELKGNGFGSDVISFYNLKKNSLDIILVENVNNFTNGPVITDKPLITPIVPNAIFS